MVTITLEQRELDFSLENLLIRSRIACMGQNKYTESSIAIATMVNGSFFFFVFARFPPLVFTAGKKSTKQRTFEVRENEPRVR